MNPTTDTVEGLTELDQAIADENAIAHRLAELTTQRATLARQLEERRAAAGMAVASGSSSTAAIRTKVRDLSSDLEAQDSAIAIVTDELSMARERQLRIAVARAESLTQQAVQRQREALSAIDAAVRRMAAELAELASAHRRDAGIAFSAWVALQGARKDAGLRVAGPHEGPADPHWASFLDLHPTVDEMLKYAAGTTRLQLIASSGTAIVQARAMAINSHLEHTAR